MRISYGGISSAPGSKGGADPGRIVGGVETRDDCPYGEESIPRAVVVSPVEIKSVVHDA